MLGKLIKNEFRNMGRLLLLINTIVLGMHLLSIVIEKVFDSRVLDGTIFKSVVVIFASVYVISIIAVNIIIVLIFAVRFYRKVYSVEGYLTHTLPVKKSGIYFAMLISSGIGTIITAVISAGYPLLRIVNEIFAQNNLTFSDFMNISAGYNVTGYTIFIFAMGVILSVFSMFALIFLCVSIGQNWKAHPVLGSILSYWGITTALQIFGVTVLISISNTELGKTLFGVDKLPGEVLNAVSFCGVISESIGIAIMSGISIFIMKRRLDLQ